MPKGISYRFCFIFCCLLVLLYLSVALNIPVLRQLLSGPAPNRIRGLLGNLYPDRCWRYWFARNVPENGRSERQSAAPAGVLKERLEFEHLAMAIACAVLALLMVVMPFVSRGV